MKLTILGSSPAVPGPGGASSGYLLESAETSLLLDCGHGVTSVLQTVTSIRNLTAILISHMHPDHFFDLIPLRYAYLFQQIPPVPLLLPPMGLAVFRRLQEAIGLSENFLERCFDVAEFDPETTLVALPGVEIEFAPAQHFIPAYAMRFRQKAGADRDLAYTGDTGWVDTVVDLFRGAAVGLVEATLLHHSRPSSDEYGHLTAADAGRLARDAGLQSLILTHYWYALRDELRAAARDTFGGEVEMAQERQTFVI
jgi:ribonuclease BN (tRNA processing enzyme)